MRGIKIGSYIGLTLAATALGAHGAVGTLSGPFIHGNLEIFLVHGDTQLEQRHYATLSEAMAKGIVVVKETGNVQELSVENLAKNITVFLNAGDIVKGGRQDRTVRDDLVLPPRSGPVPLTSFCVEHGRWTRRGGEDDAAFGSNSKVLSSRGLKMASRYGQSQGEVWSGIADQQSKLNENVARLTAKSVDIRNAASASSLQLTLENKDLDLAKKPYLEALEPILNGKTDVIGFVYAIHGEINSAEVYNNKNLFRALWPKLLDAAVTEAIAEYHPENRSRARSPQLQEVKAFFTTAVSGSVTERLVWKSTRIKTYTTPTTALFEALDLEAGGTWIHKSFINNAKDPLTVPLDPGSAQSEGARRRAD